MITIPRLVSRLFKVFTMFTEEQLLPISALQHLLFCERQCALIHVERLWAENRWTVEGRHLHEKAHQAGSQIYAGLRTARGLPLRSFRLGLFGQADVVEFRRVERIVNRPYIATPVEYKRGKPKKNDSDRVQLCAEALCLEEMLAFRIEKGQIYYGTRRRRTDVAFDHDLRQRTEQTCRRLHQLINERLTPRVQREPKCDNCSLFPICLPQATAPSRSARRTFARQLAASLAKDGPQTDFGND